jgi:hypothetical protein
MKNGDAQITCLRHHVSHYRVIRDTCLGSSPISIHWRHAKLECVSHYTTHLRRALRVSVTDLIAGWGNMTLTRDTPEVMRLPLLKNSRRDLSYCVANLIASWGHCGTNRRHTLLVSYLMPPMSILVTGCILELARIWQLHCQDKQHTHT